MTKLHDKVERNFVKYKIHYFNMQIADGYKRSSL